jgi:hypothetical protein
LKLARIISTVRIRRFSALATALFVIGAAASLHAQLGPQEQAIYNLMSSNPQQGRPFLKYDPILEKSRACPRGGHGGAPLFWARKSRRSWAELDGGECGLSVAGMVGHSDDAELH